MAAVPRRCAYRRGVRHRERYFTVESTQAWPDRREFECEVDYGSYGSNRRVRDSSTGNQTGTIGSSEVAGDGLRLIHRVPDAGLFSYIACEQIGRASVTGVLVQDFKRWFGRRHNGYRIEVEYLEDSDAWEQFLEGANLRDLRSSVRNPPIRTELVDPLESITMFGPVVEEMFSHGDG